MKIALGDASKADVVAKFAFEGKMPRLGKGGDGIARASARRKEFDGKANTSIFIRSENGGTILLGLGKKEEFEIDMARCASARAALTAREIGAKTLGIEVPGEVADACGGGEKCAEALCEGALLSAYKFDKYKTPDEEGKKELSGIIIGMQKGAQEAKAGIAYATAVCEASAFARDIANESGDAASPKEIARAVSQMAKREGISFTSLSEAQCRKMKMGAYLSVSEGSEKEAQFVVLRYKPKAPRGRICLVGKGVTFDSGGISLKPGKDMDKMKHDKCGAAAVFGAMMGAARLGLPTEVIGIVPLVENMPSGRATKPGDIVRASNGKTIEVQNTDAEGRMILADALVYAQKFKPDATIDLATLTGAVSVALGSFASGLLGNSKWLNDMIINAGDTVHERAWELPLWKEYGDAMKGEFSDLKNISGDGEAGTITAASFLSNFSGEAPWAHIDIAGTSYSYRPKPYFPALGANGFGVRLLVKLISDWEMPSKTKKSAD